MQNLLTLRHRFGIEFWNTLWFRLPCCCIAFGIIHVVMSPTVFFVLCSAEKSTQRLRLTRYTTQYIFLNYEVKSRVMWRVMHNVSSWPPQGMMLAFSLLKIMFLWIYAILRVLCRAEWQKWNGKHGMICDFLRECDRTLVSALNDFFNLSQRSR